MKAVFEDLRQVSLHKKNDQDFDDAIRFTKKYKLVFSFPPINIYNDFS